MRPSTPHSARRRQRWIALIAIVAGAAAGAPAARAYTIQNDTGFSVTFTVYVNTFAFTSNTVPAHGSFTCPAGQLCNVLGADPNAIYTLKFRVGQFTGPYEAYLDMAAGGTVNITQVPRLWGVRNDIRGVSFGPTGDTLDYTSPSPAPLEPASRSVQFIATADCQYWEHNCCNAQGENETQTCLAPNNHQCNEAAEDNANADATHRRLRVELSDDRDLRGIVLAGDLTNTSYLHDEWDWYLASWTENQTKLDLLPYVYEGLGNHDYAAAHDTIRAHVRDHSRNTVRTSQSPLPGCHYSWDWHDVHFVQLNLMPADGPSADLPDYDPYDALTYLANDLQTYVGNSKRPVVLIHHYGFDQFSTDGWWDDSQRLAYWNVLANYNVRAILTGHWHKAPNSGSRLVNWSRPAGATGGPASLINYNVSAARSGAFCTVDLGPNNAFRAKVLDADGVQNDEICVLAGDGIYVDGAAASGDGSPMAPWPTVGAGVDALMDLPGWCHSGFWNKLLIQGGHYPEAVHFGGKPMWIRSSGGVVRIGS